MLGAIAAAALTVSLTITTQNVRVTLPADAARHDITQAAEHSSVLLTQEMGRRRASSFAPAGWGTAHFSGLYRGDCATYWKRSSWQLVRSWAVPVTFAPFRAGHRWALVTVLRGHRTTVAVVCTHQVTAGTRRPAVARATTARVAALLATLAGRWGHVVIGGDWNIRYLAARDLAGFPHRVLTAAGMRSRVPVSATAGGGARLDYFYWHGARIHSQHLLRDTRSDHNGVRLHLRLRKG